mgnify:CR=1 FL=1
MMDHRAAQSESIAKLTGVPGKRIKHGAVYFILMLIPLLALKWDLAYGHINGAL